ncbi:MAG: CoA-binding protein [Planctomycetes bacterium]|nr:CoA-binding protein [Planctomycetota bacterium]
MTTNPDDNSLRALLQESKTIAVVGFSKNPARPSHWIAEYLQQNGYRVIPVNPGLELGLGKICYKTLADVPGAIDIVNIFRSPRHVPDVVRAAIIKNARAVWMQEGAENEEAAADARAAGLVTVVGRCIFQDHARLVRGL